MNNLPPTEHASRVRSYRRPVASTLRLKLLVSLNRLRRRARRRATGLQSPSAIAEPS